MLYFSFTLKLKLQGCEKNKKVLNKSECTEGTMGVLAALNSQSNMTNFYVKLCDGTFNL